MSFSIVLIKKDDGAYEIVGTPPEHNPAKIAVSGHVENGQTVDLIARVDGLSASASRREYPI